MSTRTVQPEPVRTGSPIDHRPFLLPGILLAAGLAVFVGVSAAHPGGADPNDHPAIFAIYARSTTWIGVHLGKYAGFAGMLAGLCLLVRALAPRPGPELALGTVGLVLAGVALALTTVRYAVGGVGLKRALDAWAAATPAGRPARFAAAESVRWLEEGMASYQAFVLGAALLCTGALIVQTRRAPLGVAAILAIGGLEYLVVGWISGVAGFAAERAIPTEFAEICLFAAGIWLLGFGARRPRGAVPA